jgi:polyribonucleotide nucleotidyltransferase
MDIKVEGITPAILKAALAAAGAGRRHVLAQMLKAAPAPRGALSAHAPRIGRLAIPTDKIGLVIGPGGRTARAITEATGAEVQVEQDGALTLKGPTEASIEAAAAWIEGMVTDPAAGRVYRRARVVDIKPFGAFVEVAPRREGLLHVSEWDVGRTEDVGAVCKAGDLVDVMVLEVGKADGRLKLSRKAVLVADAADAAAAAAAAAAAVEPLLGPPTPRGGG